MDDQLPGRFWVNACNDLEAVEVEQHRGVAIVYLWERARLEDDCELGGGNFQREY
jgi:hypothetical protein